jgi:hypothetical protein
MAQVESSYEGAPGIGTGTSQCEKGRSPLIVGGPAHWAFGR